METGTLFRAWRDVIRVPLVVLLVGIAGCGGKETSPADVATPSSSVTCRSCFNAIGWALPIHLAGDVQCDN